MEEEASEARATGIDVVADAPWGTHFCEFYATKDDLLDTLVPYFKAGLDSGEFCMWVTSSTLGVREAWEALARAVPDLGARRQQGRIEVIPYTEWYLEGGRFDQYRVLKGWIAKLDQALARGCAGLRLSGDTFWLERSDWKGFAEYEAAIDAVLGQYRILALCTYSLERCGAAEIADVIRNHQFALIKRNGVWEALQSFERRRMQQSLDAERRTAEAALRHMNESLLEADRCKNEFLAVLSHELRNPLTPIQNSLFILRRAAPGSLQARRAMAILDRQVGQLAHLVDDLLDVTRISRSKIRLRREHVELNELVRCTLEDHRSCFEEGGVQLELRPAPARLHVDGDRNRLAQVLGNLLTNACKFSSRGGRVVVSVLEETRAGQAVLSVADNGAGMTQATLSDLFQPFMQADKTLDRSRGGLGLGLALVKGLVELHGGEVCARSAGLGEGAEFLVRLPLERVEHAEPSLGSLNEGR